MANHSRLPVWLRGSLIDPLALNHVREVLAELKLGTVCDAAACPNRSYCFRHSTATFLILGQVCTRSCTFCSVKKGTPIHVDPREPGRIVQAVSRLSIDHVVVTSVTRDDLADGGASQFARVINEVRAFNSKASVEVLVPDFAGKRSSLQTVVEARPHVIAHNLETVSHLYPKVRPGADYARSLDLLRDCKRMDGQIVTKSGLMLGLGETRPEVIEALRDLRKAGCDLLTIGQYLRPTLGHHEVIRFVPPEEFDEYAAIASDLGFKAAASSPLARSSFKAGEMFRAAAGEAARLREFANGMEQAK